MESYITKKYNQNIETSRTTIHHYEKEIIKKAVSNEIILEQNTQVYIISNYDFNELTNSLVINTLPNTADTSLIVSTENYNFNTYVLTITTTHKAISNYTYEFNENEKKRKIRIPEEFYIDRIETEFREIMRDA